MTTINIYNAFRTERPVHEIFDALKRYRNQFGRTKAGEIFADAPKTIQIAGKEYALSACSAQILGGYIYSHNHHAASPFKIHQTFGLQVMKGFTVLWLFGFEGYQILETPEDCLNIPDIREWHFQTESEPWFEPQLAEARNLPWYHYKRMFLPYWRRTLTKDWEARRSSFSEVRFPMDSMLMFTLETPATAYCVGNCLYAMLHPNGKDSNGKT